MKTFEVRFPLATGYTLNLLVADISGAHAAESIRRTMRDIGVKADGGISVREVIIHDGLGHREPPPADPWPPASPPMDDDAESGAEDGDKDAIEAEADAEIEASTNARTYGA